MNQKRFQFLTVFALLVSSLFYFTSCGSDKKDEPGPGSGNGGSGSTSTTQLKKLLTSNTWFGRTEEINEEYHDTYTERYYFLENGKGLIDCYQKNESIYGTDRYTYTNYFTYEISGNSVEINTENIGWSTFKITNDALISGDYYVKRQSLSNEDRERLEQAKYELMDDDERYNFIAGFIKEEEDAQACDEIGYDIESVLYLGLTVKGTEHLASRMIGQLTYKITFNGAVLAATNKNKLEINLFTFYEDKDIKEIIGPVRIYRRSDATMDIDVYVFDDKYHKEIYLRSFRESFD